jgi:putative oxidoreductase
MKKYLPRLVWYGPFEPFALAFIRFCTGAVIVAHGVSRLFYHGKTTELGIFAQAPASAVGAFELAGGILLVFGLLTRPVAILFAVEWIAVALATPGKPGTSWFMLSAPYHYPAMMAALCLAFVLRGGGQASLDRVIGKEF